MHVGGRPDAVEIAGNAHFPVNKGGLCVKGWSAGGTLAHRERLTVPLVRAASGELIPATWETAIETIAGRVRGIQASHGPDAVGVFGSGALTNEKAYLLGKFARVALRTSNIDYNGRFCMSSGAAASVRAFGLDRGLPFPLEDIPQAGAVLLAGGNPGETMPPLMQYFAAQRANGGQLVIADPRSSTTAQWATLHLRLRPGTDAALANGLLHVLIADGLIDDQYIARRTDGFDEVRGVVRLYDPDRVERITGVPAADLRRAAHILGSASSSMVLTGRGPEQQSQGVHNALAYINLALALGQVGRPSGGYGCVTGQGNGQGGREHGQKADQLPGYRRIDDPEARRHIAALWDIREEDLPGPGQSAFEMLSSMGEDGGVRGLLVFGSNIAVSTPDARRIQQRLRALDLLVVSDFFLSETAALADVVLPSAQWAEEQGTMTNLEGRVILRSRAFAPPPGVRTDLEAIVALAAALDRQAWFPSSDPRTVFDELRQATAGGPADYRGISYERIRAGDGVFWPCPDPAHPGTPRLFTEHFPTPTGRARFHAIHHQAAAEPTDESFPLILTTGRVLAQYQSGTQTRRIAELQALASEPFAEMHPATAASLGVAAGGEIALTTRRGTTRLPARLTDAIREDTVFVPFHWGGDQSINRLTNPALDPISRMPEFKVCAVKAQPVASARPDLHHRWSLEEAVRVCDCNGVSKARIVEAVLAGARSLQSVCDTTRAGTGCGSCRPEVQALIDATSRRLDAPGAKAPGLQRGLKAPRHDALSTPDVARGLQPPRQAPQSFTGSDLSAVALAKAEAPGATAPARVANDAMEHTVTMTSSDAPTGPRKRSLVVVGNGMAGVACVEQILKHAAQFDITIFGDETHVNYNRILLSSVLAGEKSSEQITLNPIEWYRQNGIQLRVGVRVTDVDARQKTVTADDGSVTSYDTLLLATGSSAWMPPIAGLDLDGVFAFRTLDDTRALLGRAGGGTRAVVIGGGLLGLEAARGLQVQGCEVTVVHLMDTLMERQVDAVGGAMLRRKIEELGVRVLVGRSTKAIVGEGRVAAVEFGDGERIDADLVVVAAGIRPNVELGRRAGLTVNRGIVVNDHMETSSPDVFAVGECVEHNGVCYGLVAPLIEQAKVLAATITGNKGPAYTGSVLAAKLKIMGVEVFSAGDWTDAGVAEPVRFEDPALGVYKKVVLRDNRLAGVILVGDTSDSHRYMDWLRSAADLSDRRRHLLFPPPVEDGGLDIAQIPDSATVCGCVGVTKGAIIEAIHTKGLNTLSQLKEHTRASTGCGSCTARCQEILKAVAPEFEEDGKKVMCGCVAFTQENLREILRSQRLRSVQDVLDIYGNGVGCEVCKPALSYMMDMLWCGDHDEDRSARFINDRVHANIQKDGTFSVVPRIRGGVTSPAELRRIADVAEKYQVPMVKITGSQRIDLLGVKKADLPRVWADLGMPSGQAYTKGMRMVKTCVGTDFCRFGTQDSTGAGIEMERRFENLFTPHKVKMAAVGCPRNCAEATVKDVGLIGIEGGWQVVVGGAAGKSVRQADLLVTVETTDAALEAAELFFQYYREHANYLERTYDFVVRVGMDKVRKDTVYAPAEARAGLLDRLRKSKERSRDAWLEGREPVHPSQFIPLRPLEEVNP
jgi:NAD(P)H-dependent nitrite reductase large subunit